jgi:hypothetical protein
MSTRTTNGYATGGNEQAAPERTGKYLGLVTLWRAQRSTWREVWLRDDPPAAAKVTVRRLIEGQVFESSAVAHLRELTDLAGDPASGLAEIAQAKALRQAFPKHWREYVAEEAVSELANRETPADARASEAHEGLLGGGMKLGGVVFADPSISAEQRAELAARTHDLDENALGMLCIAAGVDHPDELTQATLPAFNEALAAHVAGAVA